MGGFSRWFGFRFSEAAPVPGCGGALVLKEEGPCQKKGLLGRGCGERGREGTDGLRWTG